MSPFLPTWKLGIGEDLVICLGTHSWLDSARGQEPRELDSSIEYLVLSTKIEKRRTQGELNYVYPDERFL